MRGVCVIRGGGGGGGGGQGARVFVCSAVVLLRIVCGSGG